MKKSLLLLLLPVLLIYSCSRNSNDNSPLVVNSSLDTEIVNTLEDLNYQDSKVAKKDTQVNVYFENTMSMYGYVTANKGTKFRDVLRKLLIYSDNEYNKENVKVSLINNQKTYSTKFNAGNIDELNENTLTVNYKEGRLFSDFDKIIGDVVQKHNNEDISVIIADFVYSPGKGKHVKSSLIGYQDNVEKAFLNAQTNEKDINLKAYRFISDFDGIYYDLDDKHISGIKERPYFLFVIANKDNLNDFVKNIEPKLINGQSPLPNTYSFVGGEQELNDYTVLLSTLNKGWFPNTNEVSRDNLVKELSYKPDKKKGNSFQIAIALDLNSIPVDKDYLLDKDNYKTFNSNTHISKIGKLNDNEIVFENSATKIHPEDNERVVGKSHVIVFTTNNLTINSISFSLEKKLPKWIDEFSTDDDSNIKSKPGELSTFGFSYMAQGIFNANIDHNKKNNSYVEVSIPVKPEEESGINFFIILGALLLLAGLIVFIIINNKSRK